MSAPDLDREVRYRIYRHLVETGRAARCFELGRRWYAGRLEKDWQRPTVHEMEATFGAAGLTSSFWTLTS